MEERCLLLLLGIVETLAWLWLGGYDVLRLCGFSTIMEGLSRYIPLGEFLRGMVLGVH